ncbi:MAG: hypothetical protein LBK91_06465 [Synergistaceae bacterium]|jgi:hypothetical protein|nr:hypothetical protein [Synergistaceae bacterium]
MADNDVFKKTLAEGESVKWSGSAMPYGLLDEAHKKQTLTAWMWALAVGVVLVGGYVWMCFSRDVELKMGVVLICAVIPLVIAWSPAADKKSVKKLRYAITNRRAITAYSDADKVHSIAISDIDAARMERAGSGTCHLRLGSSTFGAPLKKLLAIALNGNYETKESGKIYTGLVFYNINAGDEKKIYDLLVSADKTVESV